MTENVWKFSTIHSIEEPTFHNTLEKFFKMGMDGLVRENIQNSLDGKLPGSEGPVEVIIETGEMDAKDVPGLEEIKKHISSLKGGNDYTHNTIHHMQEAMKKSRVGYITFEDRNTKGLSGAKYGQDGGEEDTWGIYAYQRGVHYYEKDSDFEDMRGGSYGVGKLASNAASELNLMFFANCDEFGNKNIGGTVQLIEHELNGEYYRATGYFTDVKNKGGRSIYIPYDNNKSGIFEKNTRGLKIIIPFLQEEYNNPVDAVRSVCDNFFVAIIEGKLIVKINNLPVNTETIGKIIRNKTYYPEQDYSELKESFTPLYYQTFLNCRPVKIDIQNKSNKYPFNLYFYYDESLRRGRTAIIRRIGMKIEDKKVTNKATAPYNAVLIPADAEGDSYLKSLENESHTELSYEHIRDKKKRENGKEFINDISDIIAETIDQKIKKENPSDGTIDTSDLIYSVTNDFKKGLSKNTSSVRLTKGSRTQERTLVKIRTETKKDGRRNKRPTKKDSITKRILRAFQQRAGDEEVERVRYLLEPDKVKRLALPDKEILSFDFSTTEFYDDESLCNVILILVDGDGKEVPDEFHISDNYQSILDMNKNRECAVEKDIIKDVSIVGSEVNLTLIPDKGYDPSFKFVYQVEV